VRLPRRSHVWLLYGLVVACLVGCELVAAFAGGAATGALADGAFRKPSTIHEAPSNFWDVVKTPILLACALIGILVFRLRHRIFPADSKILRGLDRTGRALVGKAKSLS